MLTEVLALAETPVVTKVARLFLVSDIPVQPRASEARRAHASTCVSDEITTGLPESTGDTARGWQSHYSRGVEKRIAAVLFAWSSWYLFQEEYLRLGVDLDGG